MAHVIVNNMLKGGSIYNTGLGKQYVNELLRNLIDVESELYNYSAFLENIIGEDNVQKAKDAVAEAFTVNKNKSWNIDTAMKLYDVTTNMYKYESCWNMKVSCPIVNPGCFDGKTLTEYMHCLFEFLAVGVFNLRINDEYSGTFEEVWKGPWCQDKNDIEGRNNNVEYKIK